MEGTKGGWVPGLALWTATWMRTAARLTSLNLPPSRTSPVVVDAEEV